MKVLLNAFDSASHAGPFPNLAIMKLAAFHKAKGDEVALIGKGLKRQTIMPDPDRVYVSCVFDWNGSQAKGLRLMSSAPEFYIGGSGIDLVNKLPPEVEAAAPDYDIYDGRGVPGWRYAIGFSSRGCNRKCGFCVVPQKEGRIQPATSLDMLTAGFDKVLLLDNNIMQDPEIETKLRWLADWGGQVNFNQGIDARVIERKPHLAPLLVETKFRTRSFKSKIVTLAYDYPHYHNIIERAVKILDDAGFDLRRQVQFYVITNYDTTFEQDLFRVNHLKSLGTAPYVMIYDKRNAPLNVRRLQRYTNRPALFWQMDWKDYSRRPLEKGEFLAEIQIGDF